ncbi:MAG: DUF2505 family protein [Myxococcales bacterium]|nr:DUF2505 family protein [Myxococcales bacterium]
MRIEFSDDFPISRDTFVSEIFLYEDFANALHAHLGFKKRELLESRDDGDSVFRKIDFVSGEKLPWAARKLWGDYVGWTEELTYYKNDYRTKSVQIPTSMADRVDIQVEIRFEEIPSGTRRVTHVDVDVRVPVLGKKIASAMAENMRESFKTNVVYVNDYIKKHNLT